MTIIDVLIARINSQFDPKAFNKLDKRIDRAKQKLNGMSRGFTIAGAALTGGLGLIGRSALEFDKQMNAVQAAMNKTEGTGANMKRLSDQARALGRTTSFTAGQVGQAQKILAQSGFETTKILSTIPSLLEGAAAGQIEIPEMASIMTNVMAGFNFTAKDSGRIVDVLATAATSAKTDISKMGAALQPVAPLAKALGISFEETAASVARFQQAGADAAQAGTLFRNVLIQSLKLTAPAQKAIKKLGINTEDFVKMVAGGKIKDAMKMLKEAGFDAQSATDIFAARTSAGALIYKNELIEIDKLQASLEKAAKEAGEAARQAAIQLKGWPGVVVKVQSAWDGLLLSLAKEGGVVDTLNAWGTTLIHLMDYFDSTSAFTKQWVGWLFLAGPALLAVGVGLRVLAFLLRPLMIFFTALKGILGLIRLIIPAQWLWNAALYANPIGLIVAGVVALIAALAALYYYWDEVVAFFSSGWETIKGVFDGIAGFLGALLPSFSSEGAGNAGVSVLTGGLPFAPAQAAIAGASNNSTATDNSRQVKVDMGGIVINAGQGADGKEIGKNIFESARDQYLDLVDNADSRIKN